MDEVPAAGIAAGIDAGIGDAIGDAIGIGIGTAPVFLDLFAIKYIKY
jgi:hypothetical protein